MLLAGQDINRNLDVFAVFGGDELIDVCQCRRQTRERNDQFYFAFTAGWLGRFLGWYQLNDGHIPCAPPYLVSRFFKLAFRPNQQGCVRNPYRTPTAPYKRCHTTHTVSSRKRQKAATLRQRHRNYDETSLINRQIGTRVPPDRTKEE